MMIHVSRMAHNQLHIRVRTSDNAVNTHIIIQRIAALLQKCEFIAVKDSIVLIPAARAEYEEIVVTVELCVRIPSDQEQSTLCDAARCLVGRWCQHSAYGLHDQYVLELLTPNAYTTLCMLLTLATDFGVFVPEHAAIDCAALLLGNLANPGLFLADACFRAKFSRNSFEFKFNGNARPLSMVAQFEHDLRKLTVYMSVPESRDPRAQGLPADYVMRSHYKLEVQYSQIDGVRADFGSYTSSHHHHTPHANDVNALFNDAINRVVVLAFTLRSPPQVWHAVACKERVVQGRTYHTSVAQHRQWHRVFDIPGISHTQLANCQALALRLPVPRLLPFPDRIQTDSAMNMWKQNCLGLLANGDNMAVLYDVLCRVHSRLRRSVYVSALAFAFTDELHTPRLTLPNLPSFTAPYTLQALLGRPGIAMKLDQGVFDQIVCSYVVHAVACEQALEQLLACIDEHRSISVRVAFHKMFHYRRQQMQLKAQGMPHDSFGPDLPRNCMLVRKVMVTPSRQLLLPPEVMMSNRVLRHFGEENALRVVFRDDDGSKLSFARFKRPAKQKGELTEVNPVLRSLMRNTLVEGIHAGGRRYEFLAWSNSQMRDHGCYMYAPIKAPKTHTKLLCSQITNAKAPDLLQGLDSEPSASGTQNGIQNGVNGQQETEEEVWLRTGDIRHWMGDFSGSESLPKMMSRMGQCFSQAQRTLLMRASDWCEEEDVIGGSHNQYTFSDGVGRITAQAAAQIASELQLDYVPQAVQVRFKGYKGMLTVDPTLPEDEAHCKVYFRKSQVKFYDPENNSEFLEVVKYSMPSAVYLNRPMINIFDQVSERQGSGCHERVSKSIMSHLETQLFVMADMLCSEECSAQALTQRVPGKIGFDRLSTYGVLLTTEPFFRSMLLAIHRYNIKQQLFKAKVEVPWSVGRTMYGVMDETGQLQYGQIFVQYSQLLRAPSINPIIVTGRVMVTKNPCLVPGDIRVFEAVDIAGLHHLVDVVVFPRYGPRPHTDEMAGSDLDGDEYSVFWDNSLLFEHNEEPMDFPKLEADPLDGQPSTEQMADFFVTYLRQDAIGVLSAAHLRQSDRLGIFHSIPNRIAAKCSIAVDFPKTGKPAESLDSEEKAGTYPDFMGKLFNTSYRSQRLVGRVYRRAKTVEDILDCGKQSVDWNLVDDSLRPNKAQIEAQGGWEHFWKPLLQETIKLKDQYNAHIQSLMDSYGISDEASLVSGHMMLESRHQLDEMEKENFSFYNTEKVIELRYAQIHSQLRAKFFEPGTEQEYMMSNERGDNELNVPEPLLWKARAWYTAAYDARLNRQCTLRSFPWIVWDVLALIKREHAFQSVDSSEQCLDPLVSRLTSCLRSVQLDRTHSWHDHPLLLQYMQVYDGLQLLCGVLCAWAEAERVFQRSCLNATHLCLLVLEYLVGSLHPTHQPTITPLESLSDGERSKGLSLRNRLGHLLMQFIKFCGSSAFYDRQQIELPLSGHVLAGAEWIVLANCAFRAYQHCALTASFDCLHLEGNTSHLSGDKTGWDVREMEPVMIELSHELRHSLNEQNMTHSATEMHVNTTALLKLWSGCTHVCERRVSGERRLISAVGTLDARQRLMAILGCPNLAQALMDNTMPDFDIFDL